MTERLIADELFEGFLDDLTMDSGKRGMVKQQSVQEKSHNTNVTRQPQTREDHELELL